MYLEEYKRWLAADLEDADLNPELARIEGNDEEIKDRFAVSLKFGTAGLRGVLGAGTNRMNIYVVRQATQGLANWVKTQGGNQTVAISYDTVSYTHLDVYKRQVVADHRITGKLYKRNLRFVGNRMLFRGHDDKRLLDQRKKLHVVAL